VDGGAEAEAREVRVDCRLGRRVDGDAAIDGDVVQPAAPTVDLDTSHDCRARGWLAVTWTDHPGRTRARREYRRHDCDRRHNPRERRRDCEPSPYLRHSFLLSFRAGGSETPLAKRSRWAHTALVARG